MTNFLCLFNNEAHPQQTHGVSIRAQLGLLFILIMAIASFSIPVNAQTFTNQGAWTYTIPAGVTRIQVQVSGAGGGGGGADNARGGNGGNGARITAIISVSPGQVLSGTIGQGGASAFTSGSTTFGYVPCTGNGAGGAGAAAGGTGAAANCPGVGFSGSGAGGGGSTNLAIDGVVFIQAGGGGGGAGGGSALGLNGGSNVTMTTTSNCSTSLSGGNATVLNNDGGGGGGGGGGFTAGSGGSSVNDFTSAVAGGGGGSCHFNSASISSISIAATGATGATGKTTRVTTAGARGGTGSVVISLWAVEVVKTSTVTSDTISGSNPKALPGATMRYCIFVRNNWGGDATNLIVTDALPAQTSFVGNSFNKGTTCADATNSEPFAFLIGSDVVAFVGALPTSATYALAFQVTLN
ncbi:hypothetical protein [Sphingorhabdus sp.]|uniref:glycine-rich domain-containing protein n=1 Tax=Sphingorhabdus sp. TaxID=1902408 RepID=UPI00398305CC